MESVGAFEAPCMELGGLLWAHPAGCHGILDLLVFFRPESRPDLFSGHS